MRARGVLLCSLAVLSTPSQADLETLNARSAGMAGANLISGHHMDAAVNPALLSKGPRDRFGFSLGAGASIEDAADVGDRVDEVSDLADQLYASSNQQAADRLRDALVEADGEPIHARLGGSLVLTRPGDHYSSGLVSRFSGRASGTFDYDEEDEQYLDEVGTGQSSFDEQALGSRMRGDAVGITEYGLSISREKRDDRLMGDYIFGGTIKYQQVYLQRYKTLVSAPDENLADNRQQSNSSSVNIDVGMIKSYGSHVDLGIRVNNLIPSTVKGPMDEEFELSPVTTFSAGYDRGPLQAELSIDLNRTNGFGAVPRNQPIRVGLQLNASVHAQLRLGYRHDRTGNTADMATVGIGLSPFRAVHIDIAAMAGDNNALGAVAQMGFRF